MTEPSHVRILLAKNRSGSIDLCESCDVVEINLGATSLRFSEQDIPAVAALLMEAERKLKVYQQAKSGLNFWATPHPHEVN